MIAAAMGWIGTVGTILAYVMLSRGHLTSGSVRYATLNGIGGLLGATASAAYGAWPSVVSNAIWSCVALHSILATALARRAADRATDRVEPVDPVADPVADPVEATPVELASYADLFAAEPTEGPHVDPTPTLVLSIVDWEPPTGPERLLAAA